MSGIKRQHHLLQGREWAFFDTGIKIYPSALFSDAITYIRGKDMPENIISTLC
jgi:hypothetical protein